MTETETKEAVGSTVSPLERLKLGWQGFRSASLGAFAAEEDSEAQSSKPSRSSSASAMEASGGSSSSWAAWADRARKVIADKVTYDAVPQLETQQDGAAEQDVEKGEVTDKWAAWASSVAGKMQQKVAVAAGEASKGLAQAAEKAKSVGGDTKAWQSEVAKGFSRVAENASTAGAAFSEKGKAAQQLAKDIGGKSQQKLAEAKAIGAAGATKAKEKAAAAANVAKEKLSQAGQNISGLAALSLSPAKLAQFLGIFFVGIFLISISFSFLPVMVIAPQKFALLFAFGSMTLLGSFAVLKGPKAFLTSLTQRAQLPFSSAYAVGLVGTLVSTIVLKSFILTAIFGIMQAIALLYFLASYVPGGKAVLNFCGRGCSKAARTIVCRTLQ